jgi:hypothetical protein
MICAVTDNHGVRVGVKYPLWSCEILHLLIQNGKFSVHEQRLMNFMLMTVLLSGSQYLPQMSFRHACSPC